MIGWLNLFKSHKREGKSESSSKTPRKGGGAGYFIPSMGSAQSVATAYRCIRVLCDSVASLQLRYMKRSGGRYVEDESSPFHYLLSIQPQPEKSIFDFWSMAVNLMLVDGNAYIYPRIVRGEVSDLVLCSRFAVSHDTLNGIYRINDAYNGVYGDFREAEIIHLYLYSSDGRTGESVLSHARRTMVIAAEGENETVDRFTNGGSVRGILSNGKSVSGYGEYQDKELNKAAESMDSRFRNGERIVELVGDTSFQQLSMSSADMQFLETRKFTVREVCRFFGVHPSFVFDDTSNNYKSAEMANVAFLSMTLNPILRRIESEFTRKLICRSNCCRYKFLFDRRGIYSLDLGALADYQKKTIENGTYSVNDWRRMENQPQIEGGDTVFVSANLVSLDSIRNNIITNG